VNLSTEPGHFRLLLVQEGAVRLLGAGGSSAFTAGTLLLIPPGSGSRLIKDLRAEVRCISFSRSQVDPLALNGSVDIAVEILAAAEPTHARLFGRHYEEARSLFASVERENTTQSPGFQGMVRLKLMEAMLLLARARQSPAAARQAPIRFHAEEARAYIREHAADALSLAAVAARYGMNPSYFSRLFRKQTGLTLVELINKTRIQKSCQLLKRTEASIVEIAVAAGYNNLSHFNRYFRRIVGMSPREYRNAAEYRGETNAAEHRGATNAVEHRSATDRGETPTTQK
jgi:AraC-like DNA-binding protein